jgi:hypothetical protein
MSPVGFEPTIPAGERPQTHTFDRAATGIGTVPINQLIPEDRRHVSYIISADKYLVRSAETLTPRPVII